MSAITLILTIAVMALIGFILNQQTRIAKLMIDNDNWAYYYDVLTNERNAWYDYAQQLKRDLEKLSPMLTSYRIESGDLTAHKISDNGHKLYAMELPTMPAIPKDAQVTMEDNGDLVVVTTALTTSQELERDLVALARFENRPITDAIYTDQRNAIKVAKEAENKAKESEKPSKPKDKTIKAEDSKVQNTTSANDTPLFTSASDDRALLKSDKYGEYLDALMAHLKVKKLSQGKYEYARDKFLAWEKSKNPASAQEYSKRVINAKFGGK